MTEPIFRRAARAILIDDAGRTLLFRAKVPGLEDRFIWITPGGGINDGEDEVSCVQREVFEETGLAGCEIGPCVWLRDHTFRWGDGTLRQVESYYLVRTAAFEVDTTHHEQIERSFLTAHRWFTLRELEEHPETLVPSDFAARLRLLLEGHIPDEPVTVGL